MRTPQGGGSLEANVVVEPAKGGDDLADPISASEGKTYTHEGEHNFRLHNVVEHPGDESPIGFQSSHGSQGEFYGNDLSPTVRRSAPPAVSFKPSHYTRGKDGAPSEISPPLSADADKGDQDPIVLAPIPIHGDATRKNSSAISLPPDAKGNLRLRDPGIGIGRPGEAMFSLNASSVHNVAQAEDAARAEDFFANPRQLRNSESSNQVGLKFDGKSDALCSDGPGAVVHPVEPMQFDTTQITHRENRSRPEPGDPSQSLAKGGHAPAVAFMERTRGEGRRLESQDELMYALTNPGNGGRSDSRSLMDSKMRVRRLMPVECERLQGFPDDYTQIEWKGRPASECPDGPRYMALGNSMAVPVMRWIGQRLDVALEEQEK